MEPRPRRGSIDFGTSLALAPFRWNDLVVIPAAFAYDRARSVDDALSLLLTHGQDAKILAGGHSLLPLMKLRLARPDRLIDIGRLDQLRGILGALPDGQLPARNRCADHVRAAARQTRR